MHVRIWIPRTRLSLSYDPFAFSATVSRTFRSGALELSSRRDGRTKVYVEPLGSHVPDQLKPGRPLHQVLAAGRGDIESEIRSEGKGRRRIFYRGEDTDAVRLIYSCGLGWTITATGSCGQLNALSSLIDELVDGLSEAKAERGSGSCNADLRGTFRNHGGIHGAIIDLLVGPVPEDLHFSVLSIAPDGSQAKTRLFQGRTLLNLSRTVCRKAVNWGSAAIPAGGFGIIQLPWVPLGRLPPTDEGIVRLNGRWANGASFDLEMPLKRLRPEVELAYPVPADWRAVNGPDELSIHRFAAAILNGELLVAQRGAVDFNDCRDRPDAASVDADDPKSYPSFGFPIRAPCSGRVIRAKGREPDLPVGQRDSVHPRGNEVCIGREDGLVVVLAHLRQGSLKVKEGQQVQTGKVVGEVGNSGRTSEPHLHMHVATSAELIADGVTFRLRELT